MQTNSDTRIDDLLNDLASDYANYLLVDSSSEWGKLHGTIGNLSSNLDEFSSLLESIKLDTSLCVHNLMPQIVAHYERMKQTFDQIDRLEVAVKTVEKSVAAMENELSVAESHLGTESVFKSVLRPFLPRATGNASTSNPVPPAYKPVEIFKSKELWKGDNPINSTSPNTD